MTATVNPNLTPDELQKYKDFIAAQEGDTAKPKTGPMTTQQIAAFANGAMTATDKETIKRLVKDNSGEAKRLANNMRHVLHHDLAAPARLGYAVEENPWSCWAWAGVKTAAVGLLGYLGYSHFSS